MVGIIGAGAAGLCAVRHVLTMERWRPVVWEQSMDLGGTWRLSQHVGVDQRGFPVHSSLYNSLRYNYRDAGFLGDHGLVMVMGRKRRPEANLHNLNSVWLLRSLESVCL